MLQQFFPQPPYKGYRYELNRDFDFSAAHFIPSNDAGKCQNMHGHTYFVNLTICGDELDECGFLVNFSKLKKLIHDRYDHTVMNSHPEFTLGRMMPSTERVAEHIHKIIQSYLDVECSGRFLKCTQVIVRETPTSYVIYRP
jgi:6-pyruvoyltetrahydropterin/6-carboxytetrahydropterin synthase